jgi:2,3-bisphosphoglycerate-dependent phosphoglycerate mutase
MAYLILVRHGKSAWNALGLWTGWEDVELSEEGRQDAQKMAKLLQDIDLHKGYTSKLKRAKETLEIIKQDLGKQTIPTVEHEALNERHYGVYTGKNKWQVKEEVGEETFQKIRRSWDHPIPEGERTVDVYDRVIPYYEQQILQDLKEGHNVIVAAHGNSLRALTKYLKGLSVEDIMKLEIGIGEVHLYQIDDNGQVVSSEIRGENLDKGKI